MNNTLSLSPAEIQPRYSEAWLPFTGKLAAALVSLEEDQYLVISAKDSNHFVQFAAQGTFGLRAETTSNAYLPKDQQLDLEQHLELITSGWNAPTEDGEESTPENDPDGSPNYYRDYPAPVDYYAVARDAVHALSRAHRIPHPGFLEYEAFESGGPNIILAELGLKRAPKIPPASIPSIGDQLLASIRAETGLSDLGYDEDGDLCITYGNVPVILSIRNTPPDVRITSALLHHVAESVRLLERVNELNGGLDHLRLVVHDQSIFAVTHIPVAPYVGAHVVKTFREFCPTVERLRDLLISEFEGTPSIYSPAQSLLKH